jgi:hypothetical protein
MIGKRSIWTAIFVDYEVLNDNINYRRLNFIDARNRNGILIEKKISIDENEGLQIGKVNKGEIVCFLTADEKLGNIIKFYPTRQEMRSNKRRDTLLNSKWTSKNN